MDNAGPLLPALATNITLCFSTTDMNSSSTALDRGGEVQCGRWEGGREGGRERVRVHACTVYMYMYMYKRREREREKGEGECNEQHFIQNPIHFKALLSNTTNHTQYQ